MKVATFVLFSVMMMSPSATRWNGVGRAPPALVTRILPSGSGMPFLRVLFQSSLRPTCSISCKNPDLDRKSRFSWR